MSTVFSKKTPEKQQAETAPYGRKKGCRRGGAGKLISPAVFGIPHSQLRSLPFSKTAALGLAHSPGSVSQDRDPLCTALMVVVIQAAQNIAVHLQPGFRRLKQIFEQASAVFLKASAAGIAAFPGIGSLHQDPLFTAALFRVMDATCHGTFQSRHRIYLLFRIQR